MHRDLRHKVTVQPKRMALVLITGAALAACGSTSSPSSSSTKPTNTSSSSKKASKKNAAITSTSNSGGRCRSANLVAHMIAVQGAAGSVIRTYTLVNTGSTTCTLYGYPGLQLLSSSGAKLTTTVLRTPATEATVKLTHGASAQFSIEFAAQTGYGNASCPISGQLEITPPNAYHSLTLTGPAGTLQPYGGTTGNLRCGIIHVQPVAASPS